MSDDIQTLAGSSVSYLDPAASWACVEIFGHRKHYGRISQVEQFGTKMLRVDVPQGQCADDKFETFYYGGASIFSITPMTEEAARKWAEYYAPTPVEPLNRLPPPRDPPDDLHEVDE